MTTTAKMNLEVHPAIPALLIVWYERHQRDLPWRRDRAPYHVWISEIMLQQTRVEAVIPYYERFLNALPTVKALAEADDDALMKLWEGLGYYSRARNLKKAAERIVAKHDGRFPDTYEDIRALTGVGPYTAGAIASICFDLPTPAVDGNVLRVFARLLMIETPTDDARVKTAVSDALMTVYADLETCQRGDLTQALMEIGALICLPNGAPQCESCPLRAYCRAHATGAPENYPVRSVKKERRRETLTVFLLKRADRYAIQKRTASGLLAGMWEFPNVSGRLTKAQATAWAKAAGLAPRAVKIGVTRAHVFTHIHWEMHSFEIDCDGLGDAVSFVWATEQDLRDTYALPTAFRQFRTSQTLNKK